ncbi:Beta-tubulin folding cofactor C [Cryptosporidium sp. chipmunk genotype I]|uniref:Beta-tubulin folding cofactor C n=1 Tax=Cryptosporidium sp. chipmunk genotype I TaxID=1280935 RepID=UPI00351A2371|nr:Beta-tubulin folding cofactor C [Cryptosporidium sp. chipmunk genotype I]
MAIECIKYVNNKEINYSDAQISRELKVDNICNSKLKLLSGLNQLELSNTEDSSIYFGPVSTNVSIKNCKNCIIVVACRQIRIHDSHGLKIWLSCCTPPLIENCYDITFDIRAKNNTNFYKMFEYHLQEVGIDESEFLIEDHFKVSDFSWLKIQDSPNWKFGNVELK